MDHQDLIRPPSAPEQLRFNAGRPADLHHATAWHRYSHHIRELNARLAALAPELRVDERSRVLDFGCAGVPYRGLFPSAAEYVPADLPGNPDATLDLNPDGTVPAPDESFDALVSTQVLEHVVDPALYLAEAYRVLRPGARMLLSTHGTFVYHPDPVDLWRWTCAGLQLAVERAGFRIVAFEGIIGPVATGLQLIQDVTLYRLPRPLRPLYILALQSLARLSDRLEGQAMRDMNGSVFALVAERPAAG